MDQSYFSDMLPSLASRANLGTVSWLGFANVPLRRHLMNVFGQPFGDTGSYLADPTFEAVFGWTPADSTMKDLSGDLLSPDLVAAMNAPPAELASEYRFAKSRKPYAHQLAAWNILAQDPAQSLVVTSGTGSGKTECFMVPILDRLAREQSRLDSQLVGVRALFLYPLNALINSQRDRLRAWTHGFGGKIRYCLYNGLTPETRPAKENTSSGSEVQDRRTLRASPPPILVTNATMLEYMLVRTQDAGILQASQGKLEWIVLDEAHSYVGSQAAELALLIRRVVHAFGVDPENVRLVATSATIGDPNGPAGEHLRAFIAQVAGVDVSRVHLVAGTRQIPQLPSGLPAVCQTLDELFSTDPDGATKPQRYRLLSAHPTALGIRDLFVRSSGPAVARLTDVCRIVHGAATRYSADQQMIALRWLDLLTDTVDEDGAPFLPLRGHVFHQTLSGLWCCADPGCPERRGTALDDPRWPFGEVHLAPRTHCSCGAPAYELVTCNDCGGIYLSAEERHGVIQQRTGEQAIDEFELDPEDEDAEASSDEEEDVGRGSAQYVMLIANRSLPHTGDVYVLRQSRRIVERADAQTLLLRVYEEEDEGLKCPACGAKDAGNERLFRKARIGAPFLLGGMLPTMLEYAPDGPKPADRPYRGRQLLTFSDSRQGTARLAARLQQDAERTKARGLIYHHALARARAGLGGEEGSLADEIKHFESILAMPEVPEAAKAHFLAMLQERQQRLAASAVPSPISFGELQAAIAQEGLEFRVMLNTYEGYSRAVFGGHEGAAHLAGLFLVRELGRRPRRQNNLETMGMVAVRYPRLSHVVRAPAAWISREYSLQDWQDFLKIALDYFVRSGGSLDIPDTWRNWLGVSFPRSWLVPPGQEEISRGQRRWPSARRSKLQGTLVRLLAHLLRVDIETPAGEDAVDELLGAAWEDAKKVLTPTASGFILSLSELSFAPIQSAWICPVTRRLLDTTLRGLTPYLPREVPGDITACERVTIPVYDAPFGDTTDGMARIRRARAWLASQNEVTKLREEGLWSNLHDRVVELAPYFSAAEHSAQQPSLLLDRYEKSFKDGWINLLSCSTTMEMGIDIGGVQLVAMNNVPPHPANYLQRAGRAGRRRETRSTAVTLCKSNPHDQSVFLDTRWAFQAKLPLPVVSLNSAAIVQRHVNAMILSGHLRELFRTNPRDLTKLTCGWFFDGGDRGPAQQLKLWCEAFRSESSVDIDAALRKLVKHSVFQGQDADRLVRQVGAELQAVADRWMNEWTALLEQERLVGLGSASDPAVRAIAFQKRRLSDEYLLRELATQGFLPAYGFPTSIASFDNTTVSAAKKLPPPDATTESASRDDNRLMKRDLASRDLVTALREYAPGSEIVMDGLVYRSAGITLNWHVPASQQDANETQAIKFAWRCRHCGASGTTHSLQLATRCDACGTSIQPDNLQQFLEPAGFSVDFYEDPHNDVSTQRFVPVEKPWISARGAWSPLANPSFGRFRATTDGRVFHHSAGLHGSGYALCLACGRTEPMAADGSLPALFQAGNEHKRLRSRKEDRTCPGGKNRWAIKTGIALGHQVLTDVLEVQIKDRFGQWIDDRTTALTLAVALRDGLATLIGIQASELGCDVQKVRADDCGHCQSIFIFDRFAAGYSSSAERYIDELFHVAAERLACPKACDSACPHCVLDFDQRFEASALDRHSALAVLTPEWLASLKLPNELCYLGAGSRVETADLVSAVLRESARADTVRTRLYVGGEPESAELASSSLRSLCYRLASLSRPVEIVIQGTLLDGLSEDDRYSLASLGDHPSIEIKAAQDLPVIREANVVAEVLYGAGAVAWVASDKRSLSPNRDWGVSGEPTIYGQLSRPLPDEHVPIPVNQIRPAQIDSGDREISLHHELDGNLQGFGKRFWTAIADAQKGAATLLADHGASVISASYSDRYLFSPISVALLVDLVSGLRELVGIDRWDNPTVTVTTTRVRGSGENRAHGVVYADWQDTRLRDDVIKASFAYLGMVCELRVPDKFGTQHGRACEVEFSNGKRLTVRLDQGVTFWRVISPTQGARRFSTWFDFDRDIKEQARMVAEMALPIQGGALPTEVFVKIRDT